MSKIRKQCRKCGKEFTIEVTWAQYNWYWCSVRPMPFKELLSDKPKHERDMLRLNLCNECLNNRKHGK